MAEADQGGADHSFQNLHGGAQVRHAPLESPQGGLPNRGLL
jgi:hypothetical protein